MSNIGKIHRILSQHSVEWRRDGLGWMEVLEVWTDRDKVAHHEWVACPVTCRGLLEWLGY